MAASTKITHGSHHPSLMGSNEKRYDTAPDGTQWLLVSEPGEGRLFSSKDGGSTWRYAVGSDLSWTDSRCWQRESFPSFYIDADGFAHVSWTQWNRSPQQVCYARGVPVVGGGWRWHVMRWTPTIGVGVDSEVVAFRTGSGWTAWVTAAAGRYKAARIGIAANGALALLNVYHGPPEPPTNNGCGALEFAHTGDGKTPQTNPHLFVVGGWQGSAGPFYAHRAVHSAGAWTWEAPVTLDSSVNIASTVMSTVYDGERLCTVYEVGNTVALRFVEWTPGSAPVRRDPPAMPSSMQTKMLGCSIAHDPVTDDLFVAAYAKDGDADVYVSRFTRGPNTWSPWEERTEGKRPYDSDGKVQFIRHAKGDTIDMVWAAHGPQGNSYPLSIYHQQVARLIRAPGPPALLAPANGERGDLQGGAAFAWDYRGTGLADAQQGWAFRRTLNGAVSYWNAGSRSWQATEVLNPGNGEVALFPPGSWTNGNAYTWSVRTRSSSNVDGPYAPDRTVIATAAPVVTATGPEGLIFTESTPVVSWSYLSADAMRTYEVRVCLETAVALAGPNADPSTIPAVWTTGVVTSSSGRSVRIDTPLDDGQTYRAFIRATSTTDLTSAWSSTAFTLSLTPPTGPSVGVQQDWTYPHEVPYARLRLTGRTNHMTEPQAIGTSGWEFDANTVLTTQERDVPALLEAGMRLTANQAGNVAARNALGDPPPAPLGQPQPAGPLAFPVIGGQTYTAVGHFRSQDAPRAARFSVRWYGDDDNTGGTRTNLMALGAYHYDANADGLADGWSPYKSGDTGTVTRFRTQNANGRWQQHVRATALGPTDAARAGVSTSVTGLEPGQAYVYQTHVEFITMPPGKVVTVQFDYQSSAGAYVSTQKASIDSTGRLTGVFTVPINAVGANVYVYATGVYSDGPALTEFMVANAMLERGAEVRPYFHGWYSPTADGRYTYEWLGTAGASISVQYDSVGGLLETTVGDQTNIMPTEYGLVTVTVTAPRGARRASVVPQVLGLTAGEHAYVARLSFHPGMDTRWQPGGLVTQQTVRVERSMDGRLWETVAERVGVDTYQQATVGDRLMPLGVEVMYRGFTDVDAPNNARLSSGSSPVATTRIDADTWVIRDPADPEGEVNALVTEHDRGDDDEATISRPAGREFAIVDTEGAQSAEGTVTIYVPEPLRDQTIELLRRGRTMVMQTPRGAVHLVHFLHRDYEPEVGGARTIPARYVEVG